MKEKNSLFAVFGFFAVLAFVLLIGSLGMLGVEEVALPDTAAAETSSAVAVTATVTTVISCSSSPTDTAFGTLSSTATTTASPRASTTMACANAGSGCVLKVKDANAGLATTSPFYLIPSPNANFDASTTLSAGIEGYGIQATSSGTTGSGASLTLGGRYNIRGGDVGGLASTTSQTLATANNTTTGREVTIDHLAIVSASTPGGSYTDTITFECTSN